MERLFGYRRHEVLGQPEGLLLPTEHRQATASRAMAPGQELIARRKDGSEVAVEVTLGTLPTAAGTLTIRVIRDITERKRMEAVLRAKSEELAAMTQQLWQVGRLATVGELAASIAHELNNPLAIVSLRIEGLLRRFPEGDASRRPLEIIDQEVERMSVLVGNLLNFSRRGERQLSALDVREELDRTLELMENHLRNRRIVVVRDFSAVPIMVRADRQQLRQVFLNLFVNAGDAMPGGGTLTVSVRAETDASTRRVNTVEVVDTGVGIAPEDLPRVTEPFFTTKPEGKGTGLGLALCRRIVQEHAGTFEMRSEPGLGTTVRIALPTMNGGSALDSGAREIAS
jgi:signal transduction histidine kinase